jgi:hypothetical protein
VASPASADGAVSIGRIAAGAVSAVVSARAARMDLVFDIGKPPLLATNIGTG